MNETCAFVCEILIEKFFLKNRKTTTAARFLKSLSWIRIVATERCTAAYKILRVKLNLTSQVLSRKETFVVSNKTLQLIQFISILVAKLSSEFFRLRRILFPFQQFRARLYCNPNQAPGHFIFGPFRDIKTHRRPSKEWLERWLTRTTSRIFLKY